jgi:hypothetical protein
VGTALEQLRCGHVAKTGHVTITAAPVQWSTQSQPEKSYNVFMENLFTTSMQSLRAAGL